MQIIATTYDGQSFNYRPRDMEGNSLMQFTSMDELESFLRRGVAASKTARLHRTDLGTIEVMIGTEVRVRYEAA